MMDRDLLLGIDVGTGGCKALLVDTEGNVVADAMTAYPLSTPKPLWSEQDPEHWWQATIASIKGVLAEANAEPGRVAGPARRGLRQPQEVRGPNRQEERRAVDADPEETLLPRARAGEPRGAREVGRVGR